MAKQKSTGSAGKIIKIILLIPVGIFVLGLVMVLIGQGLNFLFGAKVGERGLVQKITNKENVSNGLIIAQEPEIIEETEYYDVTGSTAEELWDQIDKLGPSDEFGEKYGGRTTSGIDWNIKRRVEGEKCVIGGFTFTHKLTYLYPRWTPPSGVSQDLIDKWNSYTKALEIHEKGHRDIELRQTNEQFAALKNLPTYSTCEELDQASEDLSNELQAEYTEINRQYDNDTNHGKTQGARL